MPQGKKRKHAQAPGKKSSKHVHQKKGTGGGVQKKGIKKIMGLHIHWFLQFYLGCIDDVT